MSAIPAIYVPPYPLLYPSQIGVAFRDIIPSSSQIGADFRSLTSIGVDFRSQRRLCSCGLFLIHLISVIRVYPW